LPVSARQGTWITARSGMHAAGTLGLNITSLSVRGVVVTTRYRRRSLCDMPRPFLVAYVICRLKQCLAGPAGRDVREAVMPSASTGELACIA